MKRHHTSKKKILVIDDQVNWRELLEDILSEEGYEISTSSNLKQSIEFLEKGNFDLAIIDMRLVDNSPYNIDGMKVLENTKKKQPTVKAIILTGYPDDKQKEKALNYYGADGYYEKAPNGEPFDIDQFKQSLFFLLR